MMTAILRFDAVTKEYHVGSIIAGTRAVARAVDDVSFRVEPGETVGLVGESGSGKSTIARIATGLLRPDTGGVTLLGKRIETLPDRALRARRADLGYVFQDPYASLNPRQRIAEILDLPFRLHRKGRSAWRAEMVAQLLARVGLSPAGAFARKYPRELSGGQRQRVAIARAIALRPRLLIADEPVSALDVSIAGQILNLLRDVQDEIGSSMLFISHDLGLVRALCDRVLVLHRGRIIESGATEAVLGYPAHPYTLQLLASMPSHLSAAGLIARPETVADPVAGGCLFRDRCAFAMARCGEIPPFVEATAGHGARCWLLAPNSEAAAWNGLRRDIASRMAGSANV